MFAHIAMFQFILIYNTYELDKSKQYKSPFNSY